LPVIVFTVFMMSGKTGSILSANNQWRRQRSKGACRSFRGQKILKPGHPESGA